MRRLFRDYGLSITLLALFLVSWLGQLGSQWMEFTDQQREHNQPVEVGDFMATFWSATLENWQSEFLQLFTFVALSAILIHKGSAESKDGGERMEAALTRIEQRLDRLENGDHVRVGARGPASPSDRTAADATTTNDDRPAATGGRGDDRAKS